MPLPDWLTDAWNERSLILLLLSGIVGGFFGAGFKFLFEFLLPEALRSKRETRQIIARYRAPFVRSASSLRGRIANLLLMSRYGWFEQSEYYRYSTLFVFCEYFGWRELLFGRLTYLRYESSTKTRRLSSIVNNIDKAFNNREYFGDLDFEAIPQATDVPKYICKALGEIMIRDDRDCPVGFTEFCRLAREDREVSQWLRSLELFLGHVKRDKNNLKWDRLVIIELSLLALVRFLDPHKEMTSGLSPQKQKHLLALLTRPHARDVFIQDCRRRRLPLQIESTAARRWQTVRNSLKKPQTLLPSWRRPGNRTD